VTDGGSSPGHELNLGVGRSYIPGFANIDISERAEISLDLPLPRLIRRSALARKLAAGARRRWSTRAE
jgi:hypothetical protein